MAAKFQGNLPVSFYEPIKKDILAMETVKKGVRIGDKTIYDNENLYARMLVTCAHRGSDLHEVFSYEVRGTNSLQSV